MIGEANRTGVSYPMLRMTHPSRNLFVLSLFCVFMHVCKAKSAGLESSVNKRVPEEEAC
jgi:hypothetical protein